jgi:MYXO-CTERM domain-containing protein
MKKSSSTAFISAGILATIVSVVPMASPAAAQVAPRNGTTTTTPATGDRDTGTTTTYERNDDNSGLWGLAGLAGLLGFLGRRKEEDDTTVRRGDTPVYRDPNVR